MSSSSDPKIREVLDQVLQAESQARRQVLEAQAEAQRIRAEAQVQAQALVARMQEETRSESAQILEQARSQARLLQQNRLTQLDRELQTGLQLNEPVAVAVVTAAAREVLRDD